MLSQKSDQSTAKSSIDVNAETGLFQSLGGTIEAYLRDGTWHIKGRLGWSRIEDAQWFRERLTPMDEEAEKMLDGRSG